MMDRKKLLSDALRNHLQSGKPPRLPAGGELLWRWFLDLSSARSYHASGPNPIQFSEIRAYGELRRVELSQDHLETLLALDATWCGEYYARRAIETGDAARVPMPVGDMTGDLFDAMWGEL